MTEIGPRKSKLGTIEDQKGKTTLQKRISQYPGAREDSECRIALMAGSSLCEYGTKAS
jgi:hypothetical protein